VRHLRIEPKLTEKSTYARRLEYAEALMGMLDKVFKYKAFHKFEIENAAIRDKWWWSFGERKSWNGKMDFRFSPRLARYGEELSFEVDARDIPSVHAGLVETIKKLHKWQAEENDYEFGAWRTVEEIEQALNDEMTKEQFAARKKAIVLGLRELVQELEEHV
jgi:hypothetical protein